MHRAVVILKLAPSWTLTGCWLLFIEQRRAPKKRQNVLPATKTARRERERKERARSRGRGGGIRIRMGMRVKVPPSAVNWSATALSLYRDAAAIAASHSPQRHFSLARFPLFYFLAPCAASPDICPDCPEKPVKTSVKTNRQPTTTTSPLFERFRSRSTPPKPKPPFINAIIS